MAKAKVDEAVLEAEASLPKHTEGSCCVGCLVDGGEEWWLRFLDTVSCLDGWFLVYDGFSDQKRWKVFLINVYI